MSFDKKKVYILAFGIIIAGSLIYKLVFKGIFISSDKDEYIVDVADETEVSTVTEAPVVTETLNSEYLVKCRVYICGQVNYPGVYEVDNGMLLCDVVDMAGGLTELAPVENINLVYEITDNISIYIPSYDELSTLTFDSNIVRTNEISVWGSSLDIEESTSDLDTSSNLININTASKGELMTLPGIGDVLADAIITYRGDNPFNSIEELKEVPGIGDAKYAKVKDYICTS